MVFGISREWRVKEDGQCDKFLVVCTFTHMVTFWEDKTVAHISGTQCIFMAYFGVRGRRLE